MASLETVCFQSPPPDYLSHMFCMVPVSSWDGRSTPRKDLHRNISHPQKIPSKYWVLKIRSRNSKKRNYPRSHMMVI